MPPASDPSNARSSLTAGNSADNAAAHSARPETCRMMVCPVCEGQLIEIRSKFQCSRCHRICETCCEGGRG